MWHHFVQHSSSLHLSCWLFVVNDHVEKNNQRTLWRNPSNVQKFSWAVGQIEIIWCFWKLRLIVHIISGNFPLLSLAFLLQANFHDSWMTRKQRLSLSKRNWFKRQKRHCRIHPQWRYVCWTRVWAHTSRQISAQKVAMLFRIHEKGTKVLPCSRRANKTI